ncbi:MAG: hypothetical protein AAGA56_30380 [Myxococcota bacterium]
MSNPKSTPLAPPTDHCERRRVASSPIGAVDVCPCGTHHVHIGPITLHFTEQAFLELLETFEQARAALHGGCEKQDWDGPAITAKGGGLA